LDGSDVYTLEPSSILQTSIDGWMDERGKRVDTESRAVALASQTLNTARDIGALSPHQAALAQGLWLEAIAR